MWVPQTNKIRQLYLSSHAHLCLTVLLLVGPRIWGGGGGVLGFVFVCVCGELVLKFGLGVVGGWGELVLGLGGIGPRIFFNFCGWRM